LRRSRNPLSKRTRVALFVVIAVGATAAATAYVAWAAVRSDPTEARASTPRGELQVATARKPFVVYQHVARDDHYAEIAISPVDSPRSRTTFTGLTCERVYFAGGRGLCLMPRRGSLLPAVDARIFGADFRPARAARLDGLRSRARVSPGGRYGAATTFVVGHSYQDKGFSTVTALIDMDSGEVLANLEKFDVTRDGKPFKAIDFNFWGVTFTRDERRFYATLSTGGEFYLVEGDIASRQARVIAEGVECPSLSPDEKRIAFKRRQGNDWRLHVLDLETKREVALAETRSVDDQVEWLDDDRILYGLIKDVWVVPADGGGRPRIYIPNALSPAVVRS
jgi:hypothetical protein